MNAHGMTEIDSVNSTRNLLGEAKIDVLYFALYTVPMEKRFNYQYIVPLVQKL